MTLTRKTLLSLLSLKEHTLIAKKPNSGPQERRPRKITLLYEPRTANSLPPAFIADKKLPFNLNCHNPTLTQTNDTID